ncbi:MAG: DUF6057 family protein [Bacteroidales bacterium]|nr:DUF6057 family protein [Bacteroidales bacterium]
MRINNNRTDQFLAFLPYRLFFLFMFLFLGLFADHIFFFQEKSSLFVFSSDFLVENLHQPGGLLIYLGKFLSTFYYYPLAGALIASLVIWLIVITASGIIKTLTGNKSGYIPLLEGVTLFYMQTSYQYMLYNNLGILVQLLFFLLAIKYLKGWLPVILTPVLYFLTGGFAWIFCIMYSLWLLSKKQEKWWLKITLLWLLNLLIIYLSKEYLFFQTIGTLLLFPYTQAGTGSQIRLFVAVVIVLSLLPLLAKICIKNTYGKKISENIISLSGSIVIVFIMVLISILKYDKKTQQYFWVEKLFYENKYQEVIDFNIKNPSNNTLTAYLNNIALCETGKLNDLLFHFPQSADGSTLFLKWEIVGEILKRGGYFYYTIGMVNEAHRWAYEYMVMKGLTPEGLKMIIKTELINGNYKTAEKYILILKKTLFYMDEAKEFEKLLFNDLAIDSHPELGPRRKNKIPVDFFSITDDPFINVERIIATDSLNRKAFEYKLAYLLLNKDYQRISEEWGNLGRYDFTSIPVHVEEAAIAIKILYTGDLPPAGNLAINNNTEIRFNKFLQIFQSYGTNLQAAEPALKKQAGNTFWYWAFYR